jgi:hypothetical protein
MKPINALIAAILAGLATFAVENAPPAAAAHQHSFVGGKSLALAPAKDG